MEQVIIPRKKLKFTVEVTVGEKGVEIGVVRYIHVSSQECMSSNAQLARFDALETGKHYVNCHELLHGVVDGIRNQLPAEVQTNSQITLKKGQVFGYK